MILPKYPTLCIVNVFWQHTFINAYEYLLNEKIEYELRLVCDPFKSFVYSTWYTTRPRVRPLFYSKVFF